MSLSMSMHMRGFFLPMACLIDKYESIILQADTIHLLSLCTVFPTGISDYRQWAWSLSVHGVIAAAHIARVTYSSCHWQTVSNIAQPLMKTSVDCERCAACGWWSKPVNRWPITTGLVNVIEHPSDLIWLSPLATKQRCGVRDTAQLPGEAHNGPGLGGVFRGNIDACWLLLCYVT